MKKLFAVLVFFLLWFFLTGCAQTTQREAHAERNANNDMGHRYSNHLIHESSPYLLQHAHNPVDWYPWGDEAFQLAKEQNKLILVSIGYSACHWCHVMEHESFEDTAVAQFMNEHFVSIKVDREERPDVDQVYMNAAQLITGSGGWPLNALALPDGKPFYAGTYFPKSEWMKVLNHFVDIKKKHPEKLTEQAETVTKGIQSTEVVLRNEEATILTLADLNDVFKNWKPNIDFRKGGANRAPKFPMPSNWEYLLHYHVLSKNEDALKAVTATLDHMAYGGIYDHLGGGFSRYSTDMNWHVPHFEKMLYDNAQLVSLFSHAYQLTKKQLYKQVVYETLDYIDREMSAPEGGFYSALDADSEGEEGKFYVWSKDEIEQALGSHGKLFSEYYNITESGNWEKGKNILNRGPGVEALAKKYDLRAADIDNIISEGKRALMKIRNRRVRPGLDDKILTSWNALMLKGYVQAYRVFGEERFLSRALENADFLMRTSITEQEEVNRNYKNGKSSIPGLLDDYALSISGFIELYQATFDEQWLYRARALNNYAIKHFFDEQSGMFFYTNRQYADLIVRKMDITDNVIPASNSEMAKNLFLLGLYFYDDEYIHMAKQMLMNIQQHMHQNMAYFSNWGILETYFVKPPYELSIVGVAYKSIRKTIDQHYLPHVVLSGGDKEGTLPLLKNKLIEGETMIYVCRNKTCKHPVSDVQSALNQLK